MNGLRTLKICEYTSNESWHTGATHSNRWSIITVPLREKHWELVLKGPVLRTGKRLEQNRTRTNGTGLLVLVLPFLKLVWSSVLLCLQNMLSHTEPV
jgi:hypothetical protein